MLNFVIEWGLSLCVCVCVCVCVYSLLGRRKKSISYIHLGQTMTHFVLLRFLSQRSCTDRCSYEHKTADAGDCICVYHYIVILLRVLFCFVLFCVFFFFWEKQNWNWWLHGWPVVFVFLSNQLKFLYLKVCAVVVVFNHWMVEDAGLSNFYCSFNVFVSLLIGQLHFKKRCCFNIFGTCSSELSAYSTHLFEAFFLL